MIDDSKSFFSKEERIEIYKYVHARFICEKFAHVASGGTGITERISAYLYNHKSMIIEPQDVGDVEEDFPEFWAQKPEMDCDQGTMTQWHDKYHWYNSEYKKLVINWLEKAIELCQTG